jgi:4-amino-4-deoxy-L-arabinose transferase-like glycosyltransferase
MCASATEELPGAFRLPLESLAWAAFALLWFAPIGCRDLISPDEGRYATISLEMLRSGDWITPHLNGLLYFEKPPLQYWIGALAFHFLGVNEFAARLWPALAGFLSVAFTGYTAARLWGRLAGHVAAATLGSCAWIVINSGFLSLDMGLTFFLTLVLGALLLAQREDSDVRGRRNWMWAAWAAMALATLSKGLVGLVIPSASLLLYALATRQFGIRTRLHFVSGSTLFLALAAPWFVAVALSNPDFAPFFFIHEHFDRFLGRSPDHPGPLWYFVPPLLLGFLPWTSHLPRLIAFIVGEASQGFRPDLLLVFWSAFVFVFFSLSRSKLPSYILPLFPALALLLARRLAALPSRALRPHVLLPAVIWAAMIVLPFFGHRFARQESELLAVQSLLHAMAAGGVVFLVAAALAWREFGRERKLRGLLALAFGSFLALEIAGLGYRDFAALRSARAAAAALRPLLVPGSEVFSIRMHDQSFPFYLDRPVVLVAYRDEFAFGEDREPARWIPTLEEFRLRWQATPSGFAIMSPPECAEAIAQRMPLQIVYRDSRRVVVGKP